MRTTCFLSNFKSRILNWIRSTFYLLPTTFHVKGFTLIELMISIAIMAIMTTVLFANYPDSMVRIGLSNTNHKIALLVREAQVRGSAVDSRSNLNTVSGYGVYVNMVDTTNLVLFTDFANNSTSTIGIALGNGLYDINEMISKLTLLQNFYISNLCVKTAEVQSCTTSPVNSVNNLTISFTRPNPRPHIYINNPPGTDVTDYDEACIEISSPKAPLAGHIRSIKIYNTGFITTLINPCT